MSIYEAPGGQIPDVSPSSHHYGVLMVLCWKYRESCIPPRRAPKGSRCTASALVFCPSVLFRLGSVRCAAFPLTGSRHFALAAYYLIYTGWGWLRARKSLIHCKSQHMAHLSGLNTLNRSSICGERILGVLVDRLEGRAWWPRSRFVLIPACISGKHSGHGPESVSFCRKAFWWAPGDRAHIHFSKGFCRVGSGSFFPANPR